ncbi:MAG: peptidoglycan-binding domain-containing protein [Woeseiaceae bacterium]
MNAIRHLLLGIACSVTLQPAHAQTNEYDADYWRNWLATESSRRLEGVRVYAERIRGGDIPGLNTALAEGNTTACFTCRFYQVLSIVLANGQTMNVSRPMSAEEAAVVGGVEAVDEEILVRMSSGLFLAQEEVADFSKGMPGPWQGIATSIFGDTDPGMIEVKKDIDKESWKRDERESPWLNPFRLFGAGSYMYFEAANAMAAAKQEQAGATQTAQREAYSMFDMWKYADVVGDETVDGQPAVHIEIPVDAKHAGGSKTSNGAPIEPTFEPTAISIWIQPETYVILKHRVDGIALAEGQSRQFFIEAEFSDFRDVPGSKMYEPYKRVMRMGGLMDDAQMAQMEEARKQLAELDRQMASMPPDQRKMMESMMGNQLDTVRGLANGGVFEYVETTDEILVNPDLKALLNPYPSGMTVESSPNLVRQIQTNLVTLGYEPGNTDGLLDTMTKVAISQFQAEHGLAVTGEPSTSLLDALSAQTSHQGAR